MCEWIRDNLGTEVPLHFNRFVPAHLLVNLASTPVETLERAHAIAREVGLEYVYIGNVPGHPCNSTYCPACGEVVIQRRHFWVVQNAMVDGRCGNCGHAIPGLWEDGCE
jgi:pyruvate formate lyase activating enzyme